MNDIVIHHRGLKLAVTLDSILEPNCQFSYNSFYKARYASELNFLCQKHGTDKGQVEDGGHPYPWPSHTYADFYQDRFEHCRGVVKNVFECGIGTNNPDLPSSMGANGCPGASLRVWKDYFFNAHIWGADIDDGILFSEDRISTFKFDQINPSSIHGVWNQLTNVEFDLFVDDGLHTFEANKCLFENSFFKVRKAGLYVIEDVIPDDLLRFAEYFNERTHDVQFVVLRRPNHPLIDNTLIVIRR